MTRFLVDECTGPAVARWLRSLSHEVYSVFEEARGLSDDEILRKAIDEQWTLITNDSDFGDKVYRDQAAHCGVVFLRLQDERTASKIAALQGLLEGFADRLPGAFVFVTESHVRFARS